MDDERDLPNQFTDYFMEGDPEVKSSLEVTPYSVYDTWADTRKFFWEKIQFVIEQAEYGQRARETLEVKEQSTGQP